MSTNGPVETPVQPDPNSGFPQAQPAHPQQPSPGPDPQQQQQPPQPQQQPPAQQPQGPVPGQTQNPSTGRVFTEEEVERIRREEKDKLYGRISSMEDELRQSREEREARQKQEEEAAAEEERKRREAEEEELSARELVRRKDQEWQSRFDELNKERERDRALLEQERRFSALTAYRDRRVREEEDGIAPELRDLVTGASEDEIEASIETLKSKTAAILQNMTQQQQQQHMNLRGTGVSAPPNGPMETQQENRQMSADEIQNMTMADYMKNRERLLGAASRSSREGGLYG